MCAFASRQLRTQAMPPARPPPAAHAHAHPSGLCAVQQAAKPLQAGKTAGSKRLAEKRAAIKQQQSMRAAGAVGLTGPCSALPRLARRHR